jgi:phage gpG-like protein
MAVLNIVHNPLNEEGLSILLEEIGSRWVGRIQQYFEIGGPEEEKWKPTQDPQKAAMLKKIQKEGLSIENALLNKYFDEQKKPLVGEGILAGSFSYNVKEVKKGHMQLEVGSNVAYAEQHQFGETVTISIDDDMKQAIKQVLQRDKQGKLSFLRPFLKEDTYEIKLQVRKMLLWDKVLSQQVPEIMAEFIREVNQTGGK